MSTGYPSHENSEPTAEVQSINISRTKFVDDNWIAERIGMKVSTIRGQRFNRKHGLRHWLDIDPVIIGTIPRWNLKKSVAWLKKLSNSGAE